MRSITEFLSSKQIDKEYIKIRNLTIEEYIVRLAMEVLKQDKAYGLKIADHVTTVMNYFKMEKFRVFSDSLQCFDFFKKYKECEVAKPFFNLFDRNNDYLHEAIVQDTDNAAYDEEVDFDIDDDEYTMYFSKDFVSLYCDSYGCSIVFENLNQKKEIEIDPKLRVYYERENYIELSHRALVAELNNIPESDRENDWFWNNYNEMVKDYRELAEEKTGIDIFIYGKGGKHVCTKPTFKAIHNYDEIIEIIEDLQEKLKKDAQDEIDYINDPENH